MVNKNLKQVIDNIYKEKEELAEKIKNEKDEYKKHDLEFEHDTVVDEKFTKIYSEMIGNITEDKYDKLKDIIVKLLGSEENYERFTKNVLIHNPKAKFKDFCKGIPGIRVVQNFDNLVNELSELVDDKVMDKIATVVSNYVPSSIIPLYIRMQKKLRI